MDYYGSALAKQVLEVVHQRDEATIQDVFDHICPDSINKDAYQRRNLKERIRRAVKQLEALGLVRIQELTNPSKKNYYWKICSEKKC